MKNAESLTRRGFLKLAVASLGGLSFRGLSRINRLQDFPQYDRLGRVWIFDKVELKAKPDYNSQTIGELYGDAVVPWIREVVGSHPYRYKQRFVETENGY